MFPANNALLPFALPEVKFPIGVAALPAGPSGRTVVINGLAEVMFAKTKHPDEAGKLIAFLGSEKAQKLMGDAGYIIPALNDAGAGYAAYWKKKGIDVQPFLDSAAGSTVNMPIAEGWTAKVAEINKSAQRAVPEQDRRAATVATAMDKIGNGDERAARLHPRRRRHRWYCGNASPPRATCSSAACCRRRWSMTCGGRSPRFSPTATGSPRGRRLRSCRPRTERSRRVRPGSSVPTRRSRAPRRSTRWRSGRSCWGWRNGCWARRRSRIPAHICRIAPPSPGANPTPIHQDYRFIQG